MGVRSSRAAPPAPGAENNVSLISRAGARIAAMSCVLLTGLAGCASLTSDPKPVAGTTFDLFLNDQLGAIGYAQMKLRNECLVKVGFPQARELIAPKGRLPFPSLRVDAKLFGFLSEDEARTQGLGRDKPAEPGQLIGSDPSFDANLSRCESEAWSALGKDAQSVVQAYFELGNNLLSYRDEVNRELPADLTSRFLDCMGGAGYPVTDRAAYLKAPNPKMWGVPLGGLEGEQNPSQVADPYGAVGGPDNKGDESAGVRISPPTPAHKYIPTPQESALAVALYRCQQKVGVVRLSLEAAARVQKRLLDRYETTFLELNPKIEVVAKRAAALVGDQ